MDARTRSMATNDMDDAGVQRFDDSQPGAVRHVSAIGGDSRYRNDLLMRRTYPLRESRRLKRMTMPRTFLPIAWLVALAVLVAGCSSSQQSTTPQTTAPSAPNTVTNDLQVNTILQKSCYQ